MRVSAHCADAFLNVSFSGFYRTGVWRLRPVRRQRTLCGIRITSFGTLFVSAPLCVDSDLCDPDRNQSAVVGCFERTPLCENCDLCDQKQSQPTQQHFVCCTMYGMVLLQQKVDHKQHNHTHNHTHIHTHTHTRTHTCLLYTSPSPRDKRQSRMPSSA